MQLNTSDLVAARFLKCALGVLFIALGTAAALLAIPQDFSSRGALTFSGFILVGSYLAPTIFSWRSDVRSLLSGENVLILSLVYWTLLDILQGAYALPVSHDAVVREYMLLSIAVTGFWVGATGFRPLAPAFVMSAAAQPWSPAAVFRVLTLAFCLGVWDFLYRADFDIDLMTTALQSSRWESPWQREALGDWSAFSYHLQYFGYLVPALCVLLAARLGWRHPGVWAGMLMSAVILAFHAQGGGRRIVGAMILAGLFCWLIYVRHLTPRRLTMAALVVVALAVLMQFMLVFRGVGFGDEGSALASYDYLHVDDNFLRIAQMLEFVPDAHPFVGFQYIVFALVRPIPRVLWPEKPVDGGFDLAELLGIPHTSFAITAAGEFYVSFGYIGVFVGCLIYGRLSTMANAMFALDDKRLNPLFPSFILVWLFVGVRSILEIMLMGYVLIAAFGLSKLMTFLDSLRTSVATALSRRS
jgi:hypothetical protein